MWKAVLAGTTALTIASAGLAFAQQATSTDAPRGRPNAEDVAALTDARVAGLKAGLKLSADQEKNWPAVETAIREVAKQRMDRMAARHEGRRGDDAKPRPDAIERLRHRADAMTARAASLKNLADAADPLYKSLDDGQKRRFALLVHIGREAGMGPGMERRREHHGRERHPRRG